MSSPTTEGTIGQQRGPSTEEKQGARDGGAAEEEEKDAGEDAEEGWRGGWERETGGEAREGGGSGGGAMEEGGRDGWERKIVRPYLRVWVGAAQAAMGRGRIWG